MEPEPERYPKPDESKSTLFYPTLLMIQFDLFLH
jgi:hypothetical protein